MSDNIHDKVLAILEKSAEARNSDNVLLLLYWTEHDDKIFQRVIDVIGFHNIAHLTPMDTVRRWRQKIQNDEGLYKPDPEVIRARLEKQAEMQREFRNNGL